MSQKEHL